MKRSPMPRATQPLRRFTDLRRVSRAHRIPVDVRRIVAQRSGGWCEIQAQGCWGKATQIHHRVTQKMGGRHREGAARSDRPSNGLHLCTWCHLLAGDDNSRYVNGWCVREREDPTAEPLVYRGRVVYLDDAGAVHSYEEAGA